MIAVYPTLAEEIGKRGIKKVTIAKQLGITTRALHNKLTGKNAFSWPEVRCIQEVFFPDMDPKSLFQKAENPADQ